MILKKRIISLSLLEDNENDEISGFFKSYLDNKKKERKSRRRTPEDYFINNGYKIKEIKESIKPTENKTWGYHGTLLNMVKDNVIKDAEKVWNETFSAFEKEGFDDDFIQKFLDSKFGRYLADDLYDDIKNNNVSNAIHEKINYISRAFINRFLPIYEYMKKESSFLEDLKDDTYCLTHIDGYNLFYSDENDDDKYSLLRIEDKKDLENGMLDKLVTFKSKEEAKKWLEDHEEEAKAGEEDETSLFQLYDCYGFDIDEMLEYGLGLVKETFEFLFENGKEYEDYFKETKKIKQLREALRESILKRRKIKESLLKKFKNI